jgi:hypothetical protein
MDGILLIARWLRSGMYVLLYWKVSTFSSSEGTRLYRSYFEFFLSMVDMSR